MMVPPPLGPGDVDMALPPETRRKIKKLHGFSAQHDVMIHYTITEKCPFRCRGCINALTAAAPHAVDPAAGHCRRASSLQRFWHAGAAEGFRSQVANPPESGRQKVRYPGEPMETISG